MPSPWPACTQGSPAVPWKLPITYLLGLYLIVPVCIVAYLVDAFLCHGYLRDRLPLAPELLLVGSLLFGTPHIMASNILFFTNKEYLRSFGARAAWATLAILAFLVLAHRFLPYNLGVAIFLTLTIVHLIKQQLGIANMVARCSGPAYTLWGWLMLGSSALVYNAVFLRHAFGPGQLRWIDMALVPIALTLVLGLLRIQRGVTSALGRAFLWANLVMILVGFFLYWQRYYFFALLGPRVVHDGTAYLFYMTHDHNRHRAAPRNWLYKIYKKLSLPAFLAVPLASSLGALFLNHLAVPMVGLLTHGSVEYPVAIVFWLGIYLAMLHYYMEGITWKGSSPYKPYVSIRF